MTTDVVIHLKDGDQIRCEHQINEREPQGYPVLKLGDRLTIFGTYGRLKRIRDAVSAYLAVHAPDSLTDELMTAAEELMQGLAAPVAAEACTGASVDVDELITAAFER